MIKVLIIESVALGFLTLIAIFPYISPVVTFIFVVIYGLLLHSSLNRKVLLKGKTPNIISILLSIVFLSQIRIGNLVKPVVYLLLSLNAIKFAGEKKSKDFLQILVLNFLIVTAVSTFTADISYLLLLLVFVAIAVNYIMNINTLESFGNQDVSISDFLNSWRVSGKIFLVSIPLAIIFFYFLPRSGNAYFLGGGPIKRKIGFTNRIDVNNIEKLLRSGKVAFRAKVLRGKLPPLPYWRGKTYEIYRKGMWFHKKEAVGTFPIKRLAFVFGPRIKGDTVIQQITMEPGTHGVIIGLDKPIGGIFPFRVYATRSLNFKTDSYGRLKYEIYSVRSNLLPDTVGDQNLTYVPASLKDTLRKLFNNFYDKPEKMAYKLVLYFRSRFKYSLNFSIPEGENPVLYFLTKSRTGHCELFATSMALILRSFGVPTRLAGGYLGATYSKIGNYYIVRESDAHTWVEVYIPGKGWEKFDPSPPGPRKKKVLLNVSLLMDYVKLMWYNHVINYDIYSQLGIIESVSHGVRFSPYSHQNQSKRKFNGLMLIPLLILVILLVRLNKGRHQETFYEKSLKILKKLGLEKYPWETPSEFQRRIQNGNVRGFFLKITKIYLEVEFGKKEVHFNEKELIDKLREAVKKAKRKNNRT